MTSDTSYTRRFDERLPGLAGERDTLRLTLEAMGDHTFDVDRYINSRQGRHFLEHNVLLDHTDGMDPRVLRFWRTFGKGLVKRLHDADTDAPWYSYVPVSAFAPENRDRRYPLLLQVNRKTDLVAETYGHVFEAARDEVIVVIPKAGPTMPGFVRDFSKPVYGDGPRELPPTDDLWHVLRRATEELPSDTARTYVTGFSFPGFRAVGLALRHPEAIAGVVLNAHLYPFIWDLPGGELAERAAQLHMPLINIAGLCDYGHPYPVHHEQFEETNNGHDHDRTAQEAVDHANFWFGLNDCPAVDLGTALETARFPDERAAERTIGVPSAAAATLRLDDTPHHFVDVTARDGVPRVRLVAIENCPHWPHGTFARLGWDFIRHFSRDPVSGASVWDGQPEPFAPRTADGVPTAKS
ncbi:alpha/beta hydrolase [Streptomyces sp. NPDC004542]|uniref:alpha/beta hydrolase n=1 Tax=Streptomyces sp. NPDC004542 TaxID=3154281 RepID=UPI0033A419DB